MTEIALALLMRKNDMKQIHTYGLPLITKTRTGKDEQIEYHNLNHQIEIKFFEKNWKHLIDDPNKYS